VSNYHRCQRCAAAIPTVLPSQDCHRCRDSKWKIDRVITLGPYRDHLRDAVIRMKKPREDLLRRAIAMLMAEELAADTMLIRDESGADESGAEPILVPVPNYWTHSLLGAADTAGDLASLISSSTGLPLQPRVVRRIRKTSKQGMLSWTERSNNVRGAFRIQSGETIAGRPVVVVDDVLTSGATCIEIARQLKRAGAKMIIVAVAARGLGARETVTEDAVAISDTTSNSNAETIPPIEPS
jgi:predicted amidophosphoribosyltransferase